MPNRKKLIAANWKMNTNVGESQALAQSIINLHKNKHIDLLICPPFTSLERISSILKPKYFLGAQNLYPEDYGAFTGEISPLMLKMLNVDFVILGHSERRKIFNESSNFINKKIHSALKHELNPIVCIGETLEEKKSKLTLTILKKQIQDSLFNITPNSCISIAYEPVWAIGTGLTASAQEVQSIHKAIRDYLEKIWDSQTANKIRIIYGGSVNSKNSQILLQEKDIDGLLVGGASLNAEEFTLITNSFSPLC